VIYYVEVTFNAGKANTVADEVIKRIATSLFNARQDGVTEEISVGRIPYDTRRLIESINENMGL